MKWKFKLNLKDESVFQQIEAARGIKFPEELKELIRNSNGATPDKCYFMLGKGEEALGAVLNFNVDDAEGSSAYLALAVVPDKNLLPFGIDPFGNYWCYRLSDCSVVFWNLELEKEIPTGCNIDIFVSSLY